jgi:hypothetical protein
MGLSAGADCPRERRFSVVRAGSDSDRPPRAGRWSARLGHVTRGHGRTDRRHVDSEYFRSAPRECMIEHLKASLEAQAQSAKLIEGEAVPSLPSLADSTKTPCALDRVSAEHLGFAANQRT